MKRMIYDSKAPPECNECDRYGTPRQIITYCYDYGTTSCRKICTYARERERKDKLDKKIIGIRLV